MAFKGNLKRRLQKANEVGAQLALFVERDQWNIERKEEQYRADLDVCIRDSSDMVLVRGHWCDSERNAKRSAAVEGCKRLIEKGEKRNLMRLALMVGAWVYISKYGDATTKVAV